MVKNDFYSISQPAEWAKAPSLFSYSSLHAVKNCPLQWQLLHSRYGAELRRFPARPSPVAIEGNIVHSVLEKLFRSLSIIGLPPLGSPEFIEYIAQVNIKKQISSRISSHDKTLAAHPRGNGFRLRSSPQQLVNKIIRIFRQQYLEISANTSYLVPAAVAGANDPKILHNNHDPASLLKKFGVLSEFKVEHLTIPFMGIIDFIFLEEGQPVVVDFKTGKQSKDHLKQVMTYAILWKSQTGQVPKRLEVRYPQIVDSLQIDEGKLEEAEKQLCAEIDAAVADLSEKPAKASLGEQCIFCDVRQFCDGFWEQKISELTTAHDRATFADIAITVDGVPTNYGFEGKTNNGGEVVVVFSENTSKIHANVQVGQNLRILSALIKDNEIIIKPRTEIYQM